MYVSACVAVCVAACYCGVTLGGFLSQMKFFRCSFWFGFPGHAFATWQQHCIQKCMLFQVSFGFICLKLCSEPNQFMESVTYYSVLQRSRVLMTVSTENAIPPQSTKSNNSNSSVQIQIQPRSRFECVPKDTEESENLDMVDVTGLNLCTKQDFRDFSVAKVFFWIQDFKFENFMQGEWSEENFLEGSVGHQTKLCFWNICQMTDLLLMQLASYRRMLARECKYQL